MVYEPCPTNMVSKRVIFWAFYPLFSLFFYIWGALIIIHQIFLLARDWSKHATWPNILQLKTGEYPRILRLLRGSHLNNFPLKTLELGWVAFHSVTFQLKYLDFNLINIRNSSQTSHVSAMGYYPALFRCIVSRFTGCTISIYHNYLLNTSLTSLQSLFWILLF